MGPLGPLAERFLFNDRFLDMLTEGFSEEDWLARHGHGEANHAQWLLGHLAATRRWALRLMGQSLEEESWEAYFQDGAGPSTQGDDIAPALLRESLIKNGEQLRKALADVTDAQAEGEFRSFPFGNGTLAGGMAFLHYHEAYHLGQIGLIRRLRGKPGVV